jgi:2',3'-cyclic-nucleotide 2'-phosphodiesterase / 3'-nucleotidase
MAYIGLSFLFLQAEKSDKMKHSANKVFVAFLVLTILFSSCRNTGKQSITILETTDIHGVILPYDFIEKENLNASLANSASYIKLLRSKGEPVFLLDNGDNLQGQPEVYYYNFIDTVSPHFLSEAMNWLGYDACTAGNHDIETGHAVYDRLAMEYKFPLLAANAIDKKSGEPYFTPFVILEKKNIRIAVLGLITPSVPTWLPEELYSGIEFRDMVETARLWMPEIKRQKPDLIIGLFHSGWDKDEKGSGQNDLMIENETAAVAYNVPGFDIIFCGHDHRLANEKFVNVNGDTILILNGGSKSQDIAQADVTFSRKKIFGQKRKNISGKMIDVSEYSPDKEFIDKFRVQDETIRNYVNKVIGFSSETISSRDSYFGSSAFVDMIHTMQMEITGADISFAAPLSFDVSISKGPITVGDMFKLYRFDNMLSTMNLTGEEIRKYLEYSYSEWLNTMKNTNDYLLKYRLDQNGKPLLTGNKIWLKNQPYNFDSAAGIKYTVDASKPEGQRVKIVSLSDGRRFDEQLTYKVAINSYRANGGGGHLLKGAGIKSDELRSRIVSSTDRDLRYYLMKSIEAKKTISPVPLNNWKIIPEKWVEAATEREYALLFGVAK